MKINTLSTLLCAGALALGAHAHAAPAASPHQVTIWPLGSYQTGLFEQSAAEIVGHDPASQRLFVVNAASGMIDVLDVRDPASPTFLFNISLGGTVNSVAVHKGLIAAAVENPVKTAPGRVVFLTAEGRTLTDVEVGALPDMLTFTPDGKRVLVANEGEPNDAYTIDPEGSVSIIDLPADISQLGPQHVRTAGFTRFNEVALDPAIRVFGPKGTVAQNLEPEYITVSRDSRTAWVALQEANAIAILDIEAGEFSAIKPLGFKDHMLPGNELDVSDRDGIRIGNWPVLGMYQPDAIASYEYRGQTYIVTANEGDSRDWSGYSEVSRFRALSERTPPCADSPRLQAFLADNPFGISSLAQLRDNANLGRLNVTTATGLRADGSCYEDLYAYGARSFSIWTADLKQVFDSGAEFERHIASVNPAHFNANHTANAPDARSDDKGPEPEAVAVARLFGRTYAFIGLERIGGVMIYDITNPYAPGFVQYFNHRDFSATPSTPAALDLGPEGIHVIEPQDSPIPGVPLLVVANEVSGTTTVFRIDRDKQVGRATR
ncbi:MAG TPA: choice-of-anchor I family protein [Thauera sp.]|nr:choice-of-anchor I family protein [Thauera sp.]